MANLCKHEKYSDGGGGAKRGNVISHFIVFGSSEAQLGKNE